MKDCRSFIPIFYFLTQLISKISQVEAFTRPCNVSQQTVTPVSKCPTNLSSYETAAQNKNCSFLAEEAQGCEPLQYHCVLSEDLKYAIEVCAPSINIIDHVCAKYSTEHMSIMRVEGLNCSNCPYSYKSTLAFEYLQCYSNLTQPLTTERAQSTTQTTYETETNNDRNSDVTSVGNIAVPVPVIVTISIFLGIILAALIFLFVKKCRHVPNQSGNYEGYVSVPVLDHGNVQYHNQCGDDEEHVDISQFGAVSGQIYSDDEGNFTVPQLVPDVVRSPYPNENHVTIPESVTTLEGIQKMENLEVKLDSFSSSKSIYVGYRKYNTRVKSFEQNNTWSEDKKKEFSTYGFLYGGFDLNTQCFHCGCMKDDWRETDNILKIHLSLSESCAYISYVKSLSESSQ